MRQTVIDLLLAALMIALVVILAAVADRPRPRPSAVPPAAPPAAAAGDLRFATLDVYVDPKGAPLAAYQVEIAPKFEPGREATFVSFSAGADHPAFGADPPAYDRRALNRPNGRLILAACSTAAALPAARTRVARVDVAYTGGTPPAFAAVPVIVCSPDAQKIPDAAVAVELTPAVKRDP